MLVKVELVLGLSAIVVANSITTVANISMMYFIVCPLYEFVLEIGFKRGFLVYLVDVRCCILQIGYLQLVQ
jgi:hypothetical protein